MKTNLTEAALTNTQKDIIMNIRDGLISEKISSPYEAAFLTSLYAELIFKDLITSDGFNKLLEINLSIYDQSKKSNISIPIKELLLILNNPRTFGTFKSNPIADNKKEVLITFRDMMENVILVNPLLYQNFILETRADGIATLKPKPVTAENLEFKTLIPTTISISNQGFMEYPNKLAIQQERLKKILGSNEPYSKYVAAYDENFITYRFMGQSVSGYGLQRFYTSLLGKTLGDFKDPELLEIVVNNRPVDIAALMDTLNITWCTVYAGSSPDSSLTSHRSYIKADDQYFLYTFNYNPIKEIVKEVLKKSNNIYNIYDKRGPISKILTEGYRYSGKNQDNKDVFYFHSLSNMPYSGHENRPVLNPRPSYDYDMVVEAGKGGMKPRRFYPFKVHSSGISNKSWEDSFKTSGYLADNIKSIKEIKVPDGVKVIGNGTFFDFPLLETVILPDTVTTIEFMAFKNCPNLKYVQVSHRLAVVDRLAFDFSEYQLKNMYFGVFTRENNKISVAKPNSLRYICPIFANAQGLGVADKGLFVGVDLDPNPALLDTNTQYETLDTDVARGKYFVGNGLITRGNSLEYISKEHEINLEIPPGIDDLVLLTDAPNKLKNLNHITYNLENTSLFIPFNLTSFKLKDDTLDDEFINKLSAVRITFKNPGALKVLDIPIEYLIKFFSHSNKPVDTISTLQYLILDTSKITPEGYKYFENSLPHIPLEKFFFKALVVDNPEKLYKILVDTHSLETFKNKKNRWKLYKGTSVNRIDGQLDVDKFLNGDFTMVATAKQEARRYFIESIIANGAIESYVQLIKELKYINLSNTHQFELVIDRLSLIEDISVDYKNINLDTFYIELPIVKDSNIKVKLVVLRNQQGVVLVLPEKVSDTYSVLKETPEKLLEVNQKFSLYAEVVGLDSEDNELINLIKKVYLSAGNYAGAFSSPKPIKPAEETAESTPTEEFDNFVADSEFDAGEFSDIAQETFSTEELESNFESFRKFKMTTNSLANFTKKLKNESAQIVSDNLKLFRLNNVVIVEVDNKNIYKILKATPGIAKTILRDFGESLKQVKGTQIIDSYTKNGKRYFVVAEHVKNNYWYTPADLLVEAKSTASKIVPKESNIILLERSNIRTQERKMVPYLSENKLVFLKGGKNK